MTARATPAVTTTSVLLYWLLVVCGLAGLTFLRIDTPHELVPLWVGSVVGVAAGQVIAWSRVRPWLIGVVIMVGLWFVPAFAAVLYPFGGGLDTFFLALLPAAVCGYLSLSERGGLVAFWFPAMLWMLVILDGPVPGAGGARAALPLVIGLAALFVAFLRARESRRTAIWQGHASVRLANPLPRKVLRSSPLRSASQLAWTGLVGAAVLVLAAWIAPHLWQKEAARHAAAAQAQAQAQATSQAAGGAGEEPCCPEDERDDTKRARVREYFPLLHGRDDQSPRTTAACAVCRDGHRVGTPWVEDTSPGTAQGTAAQTPATTTTTEPAPVALTPLPDPPSVAVTAPPKPTSVAVTPPPPPASPAPREVASPRRVAVVFVPIAAAPPADEGPPWKSVLVLCAGGLALHVLLRAVRRKLTLRHLARPFWAETLDQRISNHWQRVLIGLRDAGIHPAADEQPQALARRVGIEGMTTCATILERVRHGVRVEASDLEAMDAAAAGVYRAAREKAGVPGRAAALLRWPLT